MNLTPPPRPTAWRKGDAYRWAIVEACPECGGTIFGIGRTIGRHVRYKACKICGTYTKRVGDDLASKAHLFSLPSVVQIPG